MTNQEAHIEALELAAQYLGSMDNSHLSGLDDSDRELVIKKCHRLAKQLQARADRFAEKHGLFPNNYKY